MSSTHWKKVNELFDAALEHGAAQRSAFLKAACAEEESLYVEVQSLLAAHDQAGNFIESSVLPKAMELLKEQKEQLSPGAQVGAYKIIKQIGFGGMGAVYMAERADKQFEKHVAIKVIKHGMDTLSVIRRFHNERQILATFDHPNIARLLDAGSTESGVPYFVMEYVEGQPIDEYCDARKLSIEKRLQLFCQVCAAVSYAHRHLVIHRDIKPSNIFVTTEGEPKLLDFGIAKLFSPQITDANPLTVTGFQIMTPDYASPEQLRGEPITTASDIYSLGVLLYQLLTGHLPYRTTTQNPVEMIRLICEMEPEKPSFKISSTEQVVLSDGNTDTLTPDSISNLRGSTPDKVRRSIQGDLDHVVMMALRKESTSRYASAEALSEDLRRHLDGLPVVARKGTMGYLAAKFIRRHKIAVASVSFFVMVLIAFGIAMTVQSRKLAIERDQAEKERDKSEKVSRFLVDSFRSSDPVESRGNTITAREILDSGSEKIRSQLEDQPVVKAALMDTIGEVYMNLGLYDKASPLLEEAYKIRKQNLSPGDPDVIQSLNHLGALAYQQINPKAEGLYRQALELGRKSGIPSSIEVAQSLTGLAKTLSVSGKREEAVGLYREALAIQRKILGPDDVEVASNLVGLAQILGGEEFEPLNREALIIFRKHQHPGEAVCLLLLAQIEMDKGNYEEAESMAERSLTIRKKVYGNEHEKVAWGLSRLGDILYEDGKFDEAKRVLSDGLAMRRKIWGNDNSEVAYDMFYLARTFHAKKEDKEAESLYREALEIQQRKVAHDHPEVARCLVGLGIFLLDSARPAEARPFLKQGLEIWKKIGHKAIIAEAENALALTEATLSESTDAEASLVKSYNILVDQYGKKKSETRAARQRLIRFYEMRHQPEKAEQYRRMN